MSLAGCEPSGGQLLKLESFDASVFSEILNDGSTDADFGLGNLYCDSESLHGMQAGDDCPPSFPHTDEPALVPLEAETHGFLREYQGEPHEGERKSEDAATTGISRAAYRLVAEGSGAGNNLNVPLPVPVDATGSCQLQAGEGAQHHQVPLDPPVAVEGYEGDGRRGSGGPTTEHGEIEMSCTFLDVSSDANRDGYSPSQGEEQVSEVSGAYKEGDGGGTGAGNKEPGIELDRRASISSNVIFSAGCQYLQPLKTLTDVRTLQMQLQEALQAASLYCSPAAAADAEMTGASPSNDPVALLTMLTGILSAASQLSSSSSAQQHLLPPANEEATRGGDLAHQLALACATLESMGLIHGGGPSLGLQMEGMGGGGEGEGMPGAPAAAAPAVAAESATAPGAARNHGVRDRAACVTRAWRIRRPAGFPAPKA